ncbi:MAG: hypothetical protein PHC39_04705 [Proteiniphilum sp.]|nr:hypothetical protein [Proteiniphilum sp.]
MDKHEAIMTPCTTCTMFGCQRRGSPNIPKACLVRKDSAKTEGGYWIEISRMQRQERILRASCIDNEGQRSEF